MTQNQVITPTALSSHQFKNTVLIHFANLLAANKLEGLGSRVNDKIREMYLTVSINYTCKDFTEKDAVDLHIKMLSELDLAGIRDISQTHRVASVFTLLFPAFITMSTNINLVELIMNDAPKPTTTEENLPPELEAALQDIFGKNVDVIKITQIK